ncbi:hypothetical protein C1H46_024476 [Malus baccata]|uniref:Terpene synthase N-terminal domain-containing protein n=1 Tax=Malus baccata TaxID=106549 RepID=A0A540LUL9_MALBA|nr:hypothetical protein C1H46_024476 [Malus baccata]
MALTTFSSFSPSLVSTSTRYQRLIHLPKVLLQRTVGKQPSFLYVSINSSPSSKVISNPPAVQRRFAQYHPTIWDSKLIDTFTTHYTYELHGTRLDRLKQNVTETLLAASTSSTKDTTSTLSMLMLIDSMQRLGVAYHFEKEIQAVLTSPGSSSTASTPSDLHTVALQFRILREHGIPIGPGCNIITKSSLDDSIKHGSQIIYWSSLITRLSDDLATSKGVIHLEGIPYCLKNLVTDNLTNQTACAQWWKLAIDYDV